MRYTIASKLICDDLPGFSTMGSQQPPEETLGSDRIPSGLQVNIDDFAILIYRSPQVMLLAVDSDKDFIDVEVVAEASVLSL
jgi:hypothetical protein